MRTSRVISSSVSALLLLSTSMAAAADVDVEMGHRELGSNTAACRYEESWADLDGTVDVSRVVLGAGSRTSSELFEHGLFGPATRHLVFGVHVEAGFAPIARHTTRLLLRAEADVGGAKRGARAMLLELVVRY